MKKWIPVLCVMLSLQLQLAAAQTAVVDAAGGGNFKTIQEAINSLPDSSATDRTILVKNGTYHEKVFIAKNNILLQGEDQRNTFLTFAVAREVWLCTNPSDWGAATLNISGNDITLKNLTILNTYAKDTPRDTVVGCPNTPATPLKTVKPTSHQMAMRTTAATRLKVLNCTFRSYAGDTVSPWNVKNGLYYFKDCTMEGYVDFYCPRGRAYAENCTFICHSPEAAIWHDGSADESSKTVLVNCKFVGDNNFKLGRYHRDAQFYLIKCTFAANMADAPIYRAVAPNAVKWGQRIYYFNCHRANGDYAWFKNNLDTAPGSPDAKTIDALWAMDNKWNPVN
jgi:pectinesterase